MKINNWNNDNKNDDVNMLYAMQLHFIQNNEMEINEKK